MKAHHPCWSLKLGAAAIILFSFSVTASFAGNFTPIPKDKIVQNTCFDRCQSDFDLCIRLCGNSCLSSPPLTGGFPQAKRNCDFELNFCQTKCLRGLGG